MAWPFQSLLLFLTVKALKRESVAANSLLTIDTRESISLQKKDVVIKIIELPLENRQKALPATCISQGTCSTTPCLRYAELPFFQQR
jgi:hypothetical protein